MRNQGFNDVTIVEATGVIGGRVAKANVGKSCVDTGAQFIHGASDKNPVFSLMKRAGLLEGVLTDEGRDLLLHSQGRRITSEAAGHAYAAGEAFMNKRHSGNPHKSMGEYFTESSVALSKRWEGRGAAQEDVVGMLTLVGKGTLVTIGASSLQDVALDSWQYYTNFGEDLNVEGRMFQVPDKLLGDFPKDRLLLNRPVTKITWDGSFQGDEGVVYPISIECKTGEKFHCHHVLVTFSLGCLKNSHATLFQPPLPPAKTDAIDKLGFGCLNKIFLVYQEPFWEGDVGEISLIWGDETPTSLNTDATQWQKNIQLFSVMRPQEKFGNVLIGWCSGDVARHVETVSEEELSQVITENFRRFTGNPNIPPPERVFRTQWNSQEFVRGGYSYIPVGVNAAVMDTLALPLSSSKTSTQDLQVLFAGEGTFKTQYGTVHGALLSGYREADRLTKHHGRPVKDAAACSIQ